MDASAAIAAYAGATASSTFAAGDIYVRAAIKDSNGH